MKAIYKERLLKLADVLDDFEAECANLIQTDDDYNNERVTRFDMDWFKCGTSACAAGIAGLHPWFRRRGLIWNGSGLFFKKVKYKYALSAFFGLDDEAVEYLFATEHSDYATSRRTAKDEANIIRYYVEEHS